MLGLRDLLACVHFVHPLYALASDLWCVYCLFSLLAYLQSVGIATAMIC